MRVLDPESLAQHVDRLYRCAWALCGSREDAEYLVQETFARVLSRPRVLYGDKDLYHLVRALRNTFLARRRAASRRPLTVATLDDVVTEDRTPRARPERALEIREVYTTIPELPHQFRLALIAVDVLGLSYREASRALQVPEATVTTQVFRARKRLAARLLLPAAESAATRASGTRGFGSDRSASAPGPSVASRSPAHASPLTRCCKASAARCSGRRTITGPRKEPQYVAPDSPPRRKDRP